MPQAAVEKLEKTETKPLTLDTLSEIVDAEDFDSALSLAAGDCVSRDRIDKPRRVTLTLDLIPAQGGVSIAWAILTSIPKTANVSDRIFPVKPLVRSGIKVNQLTFDFEE